MDFDLLSDVLTEDPHILTGDLLRNLPNRSLTKDGRQNPVNNLPDETTSITRPRPISNAESGNQVGAIISKIEDIFESIADGIIQQKAELVIRLKPRRTPGNQNIEAERFRPMKEHIEVRFPSKSPQEAWKFSELCDNMQCPPLINIAVLLRILELSHEALVTGAVTTKRDIYYRDPELFMKQAVVDRYLNDIAYSLNVERDALNVVAAAKGLVAGSFTTEKKDGSTNNYSLEKDGYLVPTSKDIQSLNLNNVCWILVIEKEATFRGLSNTKYWKNSLAGKGIIITAKGYPDIQTRQFLHFLSTSHRKIPIFCLVDFDPDGIGIMSTYKFGSVKFRHENDNLIVPSVNWLGVKSADIVPIEEYTKAGLLRMSERDRRIANSMLERPAFQEEMESEWRRELQVMLVLNCKAEIQMLSDGDAGLERWLDKKLTSTVN